MKKSEWKAFAKELEEEYELLFGKYDSLKSQINETGITDPKIGSSKSSISQESKTERDYLLRQIKRLEGQIEVQKEVNNIVVGENMALIKKEIKNDLHVGISEDERKKLSTIINYLEVRNDEKSQKTNQ